MFRSCRWSWTKLYKIPGLHVNTGVGTVTPQNIAEIKPLIEKGVR